MNFVLFDMMIKRGNISRDRPSLFKLQHKPVLRVDNYVDAGTINLSLEGEVGSWFLDSELDLRNLIVDWRYE